MHHTEIRLCNIAQTAVTSMLTFLKPDQHETQPVKILAFVVVIIRFFSPKLSTFFKVLPGEGFCKSNTFLEMCHYAPYRDTTL